MGLKKDDAKRLAEDFFIDNFSVTQNEVAEMFEVTPKTLSKWAVEGEWVKKRNAYHSSPVKIKQLLQNELLSVSQGNIPTLNADGISKLQSAIDKIDKKADPIVVHEILKSLDNFVSEIDPAFAIKLTDFNKKFLMHRINLELQ
jgi:uncharacterized protein YjcR